MNVTTVGVGKAHMKDVTLKNGTTMTDAAFIEERGFGDTLTDFVATKEDLIALADTLVDKLLGEEFYLELCWDRNSLFRKAYVAYRLERVMDFLPERRDEVIEKLRLGPRGKCCRCGST